MAKIKLGAIVTDIRGKLGGHVFSKNRSGAYMRTKVTPTNPQTSYQSLVRGIFAAISSAWSSLTDTQRLSFRDKVQQYTSTDIFGDIKVPSGKTLHHKLNQNLELSGQTQVSTCPSPEEVPFANMLSATGSIANADLNVYLLGNTVGSKLMIFGTPSLSQGTKFVKNQFRLLGSIAGVDDTDFDILSIYNAKFGAFVAGANVVIGVKVINANGQASPMETLKAAITA